MDMSKTIIPKSDQLNADDLIAGPRTVTITGVRGTETAEQPVAINFQGDDGKPYKPCKSMRRVMVHVWGPDAKQYIGRSMTLYCDPGVQFGGMRVGGIRISHMSHMNGPMTMALTATRAKRAPFTVQPLVVEQPAQAVDVDAMVVKYASAPDKGVLAALEATRLEVWSKVPAADKKRLKDASVAADERLSKAVESDF